MEDDGLSIGRERRPPIRLRIIGHPHGPSAVRIHHVDLGVAIALRYVRDAGPVRRERRIAGRRRVRGELGQLREVRALCGIELELACRARARHDDLADDIDVGRRILATGRGRGDARMTIARPGDRAVFSDRRYLRIVAAPREVCSRSQDVALIVGVVHPQRMPLIQPQADARLREFGRARNHADIPGN